MSKLNTLFIAKSKIVDCSNKGGQNLKEYCNNFGQYIDSFEREQTSAAPTLVLAIGGGMSAEREVSYMSANGIVDSLLSLGYKVIFADMGADIGHVVSVINPDVVYNALHGTYGEDGCLAGLLNILRVPYTGPGVLASAVALNKKKSYESFVANEIKVAPAVIIHKQNRPMQDPMPRPYVIKPISQGSSIGVQVIFAEDDFDFTNYDFEYGDEIIVEKYIKGREIQVAVLNGKALGALEIKISAPGKRFYDYEVKYSPGLAEHLMPAPVSDDIYQQSVKLAEKVAAICACDRGMVRVEMLFCEEENSLYVLELNSHPGMTPMSICPEIAQYEGIEYTQLVQKILEQATFEK
jgi:D-alanine-D-alanine ligase